MQMNDQFKYDALQEDAIRLVKVEISVGVISSDGILVEVATFSRKSIPRYTALSYRWGSPDVTETVVANSHYFPVTANLHSFLREVSKRQSSVARTRATGEGSTPWFLGWLWVDAICINQNDILEKNQQVRRMKEIYEGANEIIIWLGVPIDDVDEVIEMCESLAALEIDEEEQGISLSVVEGTIPGVSCRLSNSSDYVEMLYMTLFDLAEILNEEYWSRAWIIQEASTPKDVGNLWVCFKDNGSISWSTYAAANQRLLLAAQHNEVHEHADLNGIANSDIATVKYIQDRRASQILDEPLYSMLVRCRTSTASDPRDKIYAIIGLTEGRNKAELHPDYALSTAQVYQLTARNIIDTTSSLDCLGSAYLSNQHSLPSWVPDWTEKHVTVPQPFYQFETLWERDGSLKMRRNLFRASADIKPDINFSEDGKQLIVKGFRFDMVTVKSTLCHKYRGTSTSALWTDWYNVANQLTHSPYISGCSRAEALAKVLRCDIEQVWGDWSAERGKSVDEDIDANNPFDMGDPILNAMTSNRRVFTTDKDYLGLGPDTIQLGDIVCVLFGSQMPIILRKQAASWLCVGQAYIHGLMDGEAIELSSETDWEIFNIN